MPEVNLDRSRLEELSRMQPFRHPEVYGRDESNPYYDFLARLVEAMKPAMVLELGTCTGGSTSYFAAAGADRVISIDIAQREEAKIKLAQFRNLELWERDTRDDSLIEEISALGAIDILFIDTLHTPEQADFELRRFGPLVRKGGVILFDDIRIDSAMAQWWMGLPGDKIELPHLHWSGFGAIIA